MALALPAGVYPSSRSTLSRVSNVRSDMSEAGTLRFLDMGAQSWWKVGAVFEQLDETTRDALLDLIETNETADYDIPMGTANYVSYIDPAASISVNPVSGASHLWDVSVGFVGVRS